MAKEESTDKIFILMGFAIVTVILGVGLGKVVTGINELVDSYNTQKVHIVRALEKIEEVLRKPAEVVEIVKQPVFIDTKKVKSDCALVDSLPCFWSFDGRNMIDYQPHK